MSLKSKHNKADFEFKQQQIESLKQLEDSGFIDLYFGDESHFGLTPNVPYAWQTKDNPIIEILWRRIKYQRLSFDAYLCFQNLKEK